MKGYRFVSILTSMKSIGLLLTFLLGLVLTKNINEDKRKLGSAGKRGKSRRKLNKFVKNQEAENSRLKLEILELKMTQDNNHKEILDIVKNTFKICRQENAGLRTNLNELKEVSQLNKSRIDNIEKKLASVSVIVNDYNERNRSIELYGNLTKEIDIL